ncbi:hypothetical protein F0U60_09395 [Archangium minus]|uniref:Uncharacterized protein n=1 Tax=Archangium minus TaxID=83450 RepID=A0ABY9WTF6_9BACT|nr:hypothetical protein F0U61_09380 [Archangium violaceum]WNG44301.1 hypothetical protein F0U60_09395 [Archangium minus]
MSFESVRNFLEVLGGARPPPERLASQPLFHLFLGVLWFAMFLTTLAFIGRATKFIYVDF